VIFSLLLTCVAIALFIGAFVVGGCYEVIQNDRKSFCPTFTCAVHHEVIDARV
jgi:hypothetical protein